MTRRFLDAIGALSILALLTASVAGLFVVRERISVTVAEPALESRGPDPVALLGGDVALLRGDLQALTGALSEQMQALHDLLAEEGAQRDAALRAEIRGLSGGLARSEATLEQAVEKGERFAAELEGLQRELSRRPPIDAAEVAAAAPIDEPRIAEASAIEAPAPVEAVRAPAKRFLAFELPSQSFAFDRPQAFEIVPSLSRVGFDAKSTLHDFSGTTSAVHGRFAACLGEPGSLCRGEIQVETAALDTGNASRDEGLREHLAAPENPAILFAIERFEPDAVDPVARSVRGTVHGTMTIRGVSLALAMPVVATVDAAKRLSIEGEVALDLRDFQVPVPSKLGMISMEPEVRVWIALRARCSGLVAGEGAHGS